MTYWLILMVWNAQVQTVAIEKVEFSTKKSCQMAVLELKEMVDSEDGSKIGHAIAICVQK